MKSRTTSFDWERAAWIVLLVAITAVPLAIPKLPSSALPLAVTVFGLLQTTVLIIGVSLALILWSVALLTRRTRVVYSRAMLALAMLVAWAGVATVAGYEPLRSLFGSSSSALAFVHFYAYCSLTFLVIQLVGTQRRLTQLTWGVVGSATVVAAIALMQQLLGIDIFRLPVEDWVVGRGFSTIGNPDHLGTFLVVPCVLSAMLAVSEPGGRRRVAAFVCFAATTAALIGTLTRGAWLGAVVGIAVVALLLWKGRRVDMKNSRTLVFVGIAIAAVAVALVASNGDELASRFVTSPTGTADTATLLDKINFASSDRINVWRSALLGVAERPLTGTGPAAFELGWYPHAIDATSGGGTGALADDPHSLPVLVLATTGVPGLIAYLGVVLTALVLGAKTTVRLTRAQNLSGKGLLYVAWFAASCAGTVSLLVAAVSTPIIAYAFLGYAVLLRPTAGPAKVDGDWARRLVPASLALATGIALLVSAWPNLAADVGAAGVYRGADQTSMSNAVLTAPWNMDVQKTYFRWRASQVRGVLDTGADATEATYALAAELEAAGRARTHEFYFPALRAQILAQLSERTGADSDAEAAVAAADEALAIMPSSLPARVNKALALSDLERFAEMAQALDGYWQAETGSPYPGILYAQALALSSNVESAGPVFDELRSRFPGDTSIDTAQQQVIQYVEQQ